MIFILWWIMLVLVSGLQAQEIGQSQKIDKTVNEKLLNFHHAVNKARQELENLRSSYDEGLDSATDHRQRRNSIDDMLASFAQDAPKSCNDEAAAAAGSGQDEKALEMAADAWFRGIQASLSKRQSQVQAKEISTGSKQVRAVPSKDHAKSFINNYEKAMERTEIGKVKLKYKNVPEDTIILQAERSKTPYQEEDSHAATQLDIKLKQVQQLLHDHEEKLERQRLYKSNNNEKVNVKTTESEEKLPQYGDGPIPEGVYEQTLARLNFPHLKANNLSHEANYKLSKIEQEASERAAKIPIRYPFKRSSSSNFNPMNEIKLKTSNRLMRRGMGPSLPSNSLADSRRSHLVDDMIRRRERQMQQEQSQLEDHMDPIMPQQYEAFSNSNLDGSDSMRQTMDSPQSYDYRLPQYEQFHSLNQRTNMRDYSRVKDYERFKREPEGKKTENSQENEADQTDDTKLESKDQQAHQEKDSSEANKVETVKEHHQDEEKSIGIPIKDETKEESKLESSKSNIEIENEANENDSTLHSSKTTIAKNKDDAMLHLNMKLKVEDPVKSAADSEEASAVAGQPTKVDPCKASQSIKVNSDAVVKLLANEISQFKSDKERVKRGIRKTRRRHQPIEEQQQSEQEQHRRSKRSVVDLEDHNGNHMHAGSLSNAPLTSDAEDGARNEDEHNAGELLNQEFNGIYYDNTRNQVPMLTLRQQQQTYPLVPQQQVQYAQQQQQQQLQQSQQQSHSPSNFRASFNLTNFFNEISKLQKIQQPQQQQQQAKLQHQIYQQQTQPHQQQLQQQPQQQHAQMNSIPKAIPNENKSILPMKQSPVHRYLGPFFNSKQSKSNILNSDPCLTTVEPQLTTINPNCVPITQPSYTTTTPGSPTSSTGESTTTPNNAAPTGSDDATTTSATAAKPMDNICNSPDVMKLNVSINANVCGDPKTKQFYGNGSINLLPGYERLKSDYKIDDRFLDQEQEDNDALVDEPNGNLDTEERYARQARRHQLKEQKRKDAKEKPKAKNSNTLGFKESGKCTAQHSDEPCSDSYEKLITGKISGDIVNAVFEAVNNDPSLDRLASVLERNRKCLQKKPKNFYQIRNDRTDQYLQHTEEMIRQTMEAISDIIDKQVRQRACIPLRPDLMEFYNTIVQTMAEQQKCREKRESTLQSLANNFSQDVRLLDPSKIEQKSRIVKKLLRQYDELPMEDQQSVSNIRDELLMDLIYLRKMADTAERIQRNAQLNEVLKQSSSGKGNKMLVTGEFTPRFIKLVKTAELFRAAGAEHQQQQQQAKALIGI